MSAPCCVHRLGALDALRVATCVVSSLHRLSVVRVAPTEISASVVYFLLRVVRDSVDSTATFFLRGGDATRYLVGSQRCVAVRTLIVVSGDDTEAVNAHDKFLVVQRKFGCVFRDDIELRSLALRTEPVLDVRAYLDELHFGLAVEHREQVSVVKRVAEQRPCLLREVWFAHILAEWLLRCFFLAHVFLSFSETRSG